MKRFSPFSVLSSEVDLCERNFKYSTHVAEFWNTICNIPFFLLPPLFFYLFWQYRRHVTRAVNVVWSSLVLVGVGSAYFHATLSLAGQLMDEVFILWVFTIALSLLCPKRYMPGFMHRNRCKCAVVSVTLVALLGCLRPAIKQTTLAVLGGFTAYILFKEMQRSNCKRAKNLGYRCLVTWFVAFSCWLTDMFFCKFYLLISFPYIHGVWHVLMACALCQLCVLLAYFHGQEEMPHLKSSLSYWPRDSCNVVGIPFILINSPLSTFPV